MIRRVKHALLIGGVGAFSTASAVIVGGRPVAGAALVGLGLSMMLAYDIIGDRVGPVGGDA